MSKKAFTEVDEFGRPVLKETHQIAEAQQKKNKQLKEAFGISEGFIEGSSFYRGPEQEANKYPLLPDSDEVVIRLKTEGVFHLVIFGPCF